MNDLFFNNSHISFIIPKLDRTETYEIRFLTKLSGVSPKKEKSNSITGVLINISNNFLSSSISQFIIYGFVLYNHNNLYKHIYS